MASRARYVLNYTLFGIAFGAVFPVIAALIDHISGINALEHGFIAHLHNDPLHLIILTAPLVLGTVFFVLGRARKKLADELLHRSKVEGRLTFHAYHDPLTRLHNRAALGRDIDDILALDQDHQGAATLMLFDVKGFKTINDAFGHDVGDELLKLVALRLEGECGDFCKLYRMGGDEFILLWAGHHMLIKQQAMGERLQRMLSKPYPLRDFTVQSGFTIAIAELMKSDTSVIDVLKRLDLALHEAKKGTSGGILCYDPELDNLFTARLRMEEDLRTALQTEQFHLVFQPVVGASGHQLRGFEALIRWMSPERGFVTPDQFIPCAEHCGLILPIGAWVMNKAIETAATWPKPLSVSVNVSAEQFKDPTFADQVIAALKRHNLPAGRLILEVTESVFLADLTMVQAALTRLSVEGVKIALDDFGTGFASINHLRNLPFNHIKIDRSFTLAMLSDEREAELIRTIIRLSKAFGMTTTLEGVETLEQADFAKGLGIVDLQGYYFSRPVKKEDVAGVIAVFSALSATVKSRKRA